MACVLSATGIFIYLRFSAELDATINSGLRSRAADVAALVKAAGADPRGGGAGLVGREESFAQVLGPSGRVVGSSPAVGDRVLLSRTELRRALHGPATFEQGARPGLDESRLLALPVGAPGTRQVVVVGTSTEAREEALQDLAQLLFIGGPVALLLASLAAYWVAAAALRPVEEMRARAAAISAEPPVKRLPVPRTGDEIARLGTTLNEMLERLAEALEHERTFVADASHELRTPLAILRTELELALERGRSPEELKAALASAAEETDRLTQLSEDLLTIAQTERGDLPLRLDRVSIAEVFEGVARRFARRADEAKRSIEVDVAGPTAVDADRMRLDQALGSMVDNALRYGEGTVEMRCVQTAGGIELHVLDRGDGFPEGFTDLAFERFSRAPTSHRSGGSGLGLSIVRTVARAHGGEARAGSRDGGGADVWLALPLNQARDDRLQALPISGSGYH